jgi:MSHA biogenesis protein MshJ
VKEEWRKLAARFDALSLRERVLVLAGLVLGAALLFEYLALQPLAARKLRLERQIAEARNSMKVAEAVLAGQVPLTDPDDVRRSYRNALRQQLVDLDKNMQELQSGLVQPERMAKLLEAMLARGRGLQLLSLRTLPVQRYETPAFAPNGKAPNKMAKPVPKDPERTVFQHSFEITLQGSYIELHDYLTQLEKLPWQMFWARISVSTEQYPRLRATLTVQTLSLNKAWLIV